MTIDNLTTSSILRIFSDEVRNQGGRVIDTFHDGRRLFVRSLLPSIKPVRPGDTMQGGLALQATEEDLWLHPYLYRQVCRNGAIMAHAIESFHIECLGAYSLEEGTDILRDAIFQCADKDAFARQVRQVRSAAIREVDELLNLMPYLAEFQGPGMESFLKSILDRFASGSDSTRFGLMNAVTSVARDTRNPEVRWRLEELGGGIGVRVRPKRPRAAPGRAHAEPHSVPTT